MVGMRFFDRLRMTVMKGSGCEEIMCPPLKKRDLKSLSLSLYEREKYVLRPAQNERREDSEWQLTSGL
jgi:hypothetical protein